MSKTSNSRSFVEKQKVDSIPLAEGSELHFSVVEIGGEQKADIRHFVEVKRKLTPSGHGIVIDPEKYEKFQESVAKLGKALSSRK